MPRKNFSRKIIFLLIVFSIAAGNIFLAAENVSAKNISKKSLVPEKNSRWNFEENEAVVKIDCADCLDAISKKHKVSFSPLVGVGNKNFYLARSLKKKSAQKLIKALEKDSRVELAQPNFKYKPLARVANDAYFSREWWLFDTAENAGGVSATSAWDLEAKKQRNVAVAVIDSGVNTKHKDLKKNLTKGGAKGKNFEYPKRKLSDGDGHGSFLSGIIAATANNRRGVSGGSFYNHLRVMALRFDFTTSQAIQALNYASAKNVPVVNASWGSYGNDGFDPALKDAISQFGGVFVTASGNNGYDHDGSDPNKKMYPCDFELPNIICVGASDQNGNLADYSDFGAASIDVVAPGGTDGSPLIGLSKSKSGYDEAVGTSLSAAFVSSEAGLLFSKYPNLSSTQIIGIIKNSVDQNPSLAGKVLSGGKVNFLKALQAAASY